VIFDLVLLDLVLTAEVSNGSLACVSNRAIDPTFLLFADASLFVLFLSTEIHALYGWIYVCYNLLIHWLRCRGDLSHQAGLLA